MTDNLKYKYPDTKQYAHGLLVLLLKERIDLMHNLSDRHRSETSDIPAHIKCSHGKSLAVACSQCSPDGGAMGDAERPSPATEELGRKNKMFTPLTLLQTNEGWVAQVFCACCISTTAYGPNLDEILHTKLQQQMNWHLYGPKGPLCPDCHS